MSDPTHSASLQILGLELVRAFHLALHTVQTHGIGNNLSIAAIQSFVEAASAIVREQDEFGLYVVDDYVFMDRLRLKQTGTSSRFLAQFAQDLQRRGLGSLRGSRTFDANEGREFLQMLLEFSDGDGEAYPHIQSRLASMDSCFEVGPTRQVHPLGPGAPEVITRKEKCKQAFFQAVLASECVMKNAYFGEELQLTRAKRTVQGMVDLIMHEEFTLLGITTLQSHDEFTFYHSANVCIYALALGKRVGLTPTQLCDLGTGALIHDLGKATIPLEILQKTGPLTDQEKHVMNRHPVHGARRLILAGGFSPLVLQGMIGCFEHHLYFDGSNLGHPETQGDYPLHVYGRLIAIVDCFDVLTTKKIYRGQALRRDRALALMMRDSGSRFDPTLLRMFTNMLGVYPIGTTVRLRSGRLAVVVTPAEDPQHVLRPVVRLFTDKSGFELDAMDYPEIDLSQRSSSGEYTDEITTAVDADAMGFDSSKYFV